MKYNTRKYLGILPRNFSISNETHLKNVETAALEILKDIPEADNLANFENQLIESKNSNMALNLAVKLARSKEVVNRIDQPLRVSVTFAMYKENNRILPRSQHPNGENFLIVKLHQLQNLLGDNPHIEWKLFPVDDGCPNHSGEIAQKIIRQNNAGNRAEVLFLADAIEKKLPVAKKLKSTDDSRKGGSIAYGMWYAAKQPCDREHIIVFTDADLSTHLGQTGLLLEPLLQGPYKASIGSRRETNSVVIKKGVRNTRGKLFIYLWKRMLPELNYLVDTQCGFKAFTSPTVPLIVEDMIEPGFAFDIELLLKTELLQKGSIAKAGIAWIDSEAESTTTDLQPYLPMLQSIAAMYRKYTGTNPESERFAAFVESLTQKQWEHLVENVPEEIASREPFEFDRYHGVSVNMLQSIINLAE